MTVKTKSKNEKRLNYNNVYTNKRKLKIKRQLKNKIPVLGKLNKLLGMLVGIINATIIVLALSMLLSLPLFKNAKDIKDKTLLRYINDYSNQAISYIAEKIILSNDLININNFDIDSYREEFSNWLQSLNNNE